MKAFYHLDLDGKASAALVRKYATNFDKYEPEYIEINYGMDFPFEKIRNGECVWIVDYSITPDEMTELLSITENVIWIDHHKSAIQRYEGYERNIDGIRYDGIAGCMLTWAYLNHIANVPAHKSQVDFVPNMCNDAPMCIKYIGDYDVWRFEYGENTKNYHFYLESLGNLPPESSYWDLLLNDNAITRRDHVLTGEKIKNYRSFMMKEYLKSYGFETSLLGYKCFAVNMALISSDDFSSIDTNSYDILVGFCFNGLRWSYSLRSEKVDVSIVAMQFGGGGHRGAAGFSADRYVLGE